MGLDIVELVMDIEDRFNVRIPDEEAEGVRTVADLATLVISKLPKAPDCCATSRGFYEFRRLLIAHAGIERNRIRPNARLESLFPTNPQPLWKRVRCQNSSLPELTLAPSVDSVFRIMRTTLIVGWLPWSLGIAVWMGTCAALAPCVLLLIAAMIVLRVVHHAFEVHFPGHLHNIGDAARWMASVMLPQSDPGARLIAEVRVLNQVREIVAEQLGLPLHKVQPESDIVKDLGA